MLVSDEYGKTMQIICTIYADIEHLQNRYNKITAVNTKMKNKEEANGIKQLIKQKFQIHKV